MGAVSGAPTKTKVYLEVGSKRTFASAAGWPGWCRSGKRSEQAALEALAAYAPRYRLVAKLAEIPFLAKVTDFAVVERLSGNATTDFGAPGIPAKDESRPMTAAQARRVSALVGACWAYLDRTVAKAPTTLRRGPRGGGRDRDEMFDHVLGAEMEYAKRIGVRLKQPGRAGQTGGARLPQGDSRRLR